jgi:hypothetical protein
MPLVIRATRILGALVGLFILFLLVTMFWGNLHDFGFAKYVFLKQFLPAFLARIALMILILTPFSRIQSAYLWRFFFIAMVILSLVWFVPELVNIIFNSSYGKICEVLLFAGFLLTQMLAIWLTRYPSPIRRKHP